MLFNFLFIHLFDVILKDKMPFKFLIRICFAVKRQNEIFVA